jgi:hypothetical protein
MNWRVSGSIGCTLPKHSNQYGTPKKPTSNNLREIGYVNGERERERERERGVLRQVTIACNVLVHGFRYKSQAGLLIINLQKI